MTRRTRGDIRADWIAVVIAFVVLITLAGGFVVTGVYVMNVAAHFMEDR